MSIRFSDNIMASIEGSDFVVRNRIPRSIQILLIFIAAFDLICLSAYLTDDTSVNISFLVILMVSIGALCYATWFFLNRFRTLILATEFQTAMLASATQLGTRFCFIVNREGSIFYIDPGFQKVFSSFVASGSRTLKELFLFIEASQELQDKILATLKRNKSDHVILNLKDTEGNDMSLVTTVDVIPRPKGYFIIRGRDYVEKRTSDKAPADNKDAEKNQFRNLFLLLDKTLYTLSGGLLVADTHGNIVSISAELEQYLGYTPGEVIMFHIPFAQIVQQYTGHDAGTFLLNDFDGQVTFRRKNTSTVALQVHQVLVGDDSQTLGISTAVHLK